MTLNVKFDAVAFDAVAARLGVAEDAGRSRTLVVFAGKDLAMAEAAKSLFSGAQEQISRAAEAAKFKGKAGSALEVLAPGGLGVSRLLIVGAGAAESVDSEGCNPDTETKCNDFLSLGGQTAARLTPGGEMIVVLDIPDRSVDPAAAAQFALGAWLRSYKFDHYKTRKKDDSEKQEPIDVLLGVADPAAAGAAIAGSASLAEGVVLARTLVNEPANVLSPAEFARRASELMKLGVEVEILDEKAMAELGMRALLGVGQGSEAESKLAVLRWNGGGDTAPVAFVGKGVVFDSGGISIKPAASMEDMKGDMAGAAAVTGALHAIAARKAKANVIGVLGLVENMPDGKAQRPGDIVKSMSGQTIEIINTDAEGRLVLADALTYVIDKYKPAAIVDLATLTGAILVALGQEYGGLFSNNDELADRLTKAGVATGEKLWRLPMGPAYDKLIDSKFADMKNTGGRHAGSITAAQFLQRFVGKTPWAHLDIAGTGMGSPSSDINQSWGSGWGVRLLDRLVRNYYES
jgi:leucyl aminopeptidase